MIDKPLSSTQPMMLKAYSVELLKEIFRDHYTQEEGETSPDIRAIYVCTKGVDQEMIEFDSIVVEFADEHE
jgi:hypothetical protein